MKIEDVLPEARKGRKVKRTNWEAKYWPIREAIKHACPENILADDWELEPKSVTVTREQVMDAYNNARNLNEMCKHLGFEDAK